MISIEVKFCLVAAALLYLAGCGVPQPVTQTAEPQTPNASTDFRMDLEVEINGVKGSGMLVVPKAPTYLIKVKAPTNPEQVVLSTCHRDYPFGKQDDKFQIQYTPNLVETRGYCLIKIMALGQKFTYAGAIIDIQEGVTLPAKLYCNGQSLSPAGVAVCQSRSSLPQEIHFDVPVSAGKPSDCPPAQELLPGKQFEIRLGRGLCVYAFREVAHPHRVLRLTTHGHDLYREGAK